MRCVKVDGPSTPQTDPLGELLHRAAFQAEDGPARRWLEQLVRGESASGTTRAVNREPAVVNGQLSEVAPRGR
jgi:hypothetical protein